MADIRPPRRRRVAHWQTRIDRRRSAAGPAAVPRRVADRRDDQQIARARRGDVGDADAFRFVARDLERLVGRAARSASTAEPQVAGVRSRDRSADRRGRLRSFAVMSARMTTGNSSPFALCTVISRTPSLPSSRIGASAAWPPSACSRSSSTKPRNDMPPSTSYCRASSATCSTLASACSPPGAARSRRARASRRAAR